MLPNSQTSHGGGVIDKNRSPVPVAADVVPMGLSGECGSRANPPSPLRSMEVDFEKAAQLWPTVASQLSDIFAK